jgi:hypothetical protein
MPQICFVVMGFGKKTDYSDTPRTLDLDATYEGIIEPAVTAAGLECIRADKVKHSGVIDKPMYELLLRADLVIADISTANPNALYELGVRHALRPHSTIIMKEIDGKFLFDLNHLATFQYKHLGEDIPAREAKNKTTELKALIDAVLAEQSLDSPVYTFLPGLQQPKLSDAEFQAVVATVKAESDSLSQALEAGRKAAAASNSAGARDHFQRAHDIRCEGIRTVATDANGGGAVLPDPYIIQQLALHTYKAKSQTKEERVEKLEAARKIIEQLAPGSSTDPETLGIAGAIRKRLYQETDRLEHLEAAIELYGRGFEVKRDYYNGENYAFCLDWRAARQSDPAEADYDRRTARKVRARIVTSLEAQLADGHSTERADYKWMLATLANTLRALGRDGDQHEQAFRNLKPADWEIETFETGKAYAQKLATAFPAAPRN